MKAVLYLSYREKLFTHQRKWNRLSKFILKKNKNFDSLIQKLNTFKRTSKYDQILLHALYRNRSDRKSDASYSTKIFSMASQKTKQHRKTKIFPSTQEHERMQMSSKMDKFKQSVLGKDTNKNRNSFMVH